MTILEILHKAIACGAWRVTGENSYVEQHNEVHIRYGPDELGHMEKALQRWYDNLPLTQDQLASAFAESKSEIDRLNRVVSALTADVEEWAGQYRKCIPYQSIVDQCAAHLGVSHQEVLETVTGLTLDTEVGKFAALTTAQGEVERLHSVVGKLKSELDHEREKNIQLIAEAAQSRVHPGWKGDLLGQIRRLEEVCDRKEGDWLWAEYAQILADNRKLRDTAIAMLKVFESQDLGYDGNGDKLREVHIPQRMIDLWWEKVDAPAAEHTAVDRVAGEREKQRRKWSPGHDDQHSNYELAVNARVLLQQYVGGAPGGLTDHWGLVKKYRGSKKKMLIVIGALVIAEIERLERCGK